MPPKTRVQRRKRKVQTQLSFNPASSSPVSSALSPAKVTYKHPHTKRQPPHSNSDRDGDGEENMFAPGKNLAVVINSESSSSPPRVSQQSKPKSFMRSATPSKKKQAIIIPDSSSSEDIEEPKTPESNRKSKPLEESSSQSESSPEAVTRNGGAIKSRSPEDKQVVALNTEKEYDSEMEKETNDEDDDIVELRSSARRKKLVTRRDKASPPQDLPQPKKRRRSPSSDEDDDEPIRSSPTKRVKRIRVSTSPQPKRLTRQLNTPKRHRTEKEKKLELLRRKRAGEKIDELTESSASEEEHKGIYDTDSDREALSVFEDEDHEEGIDEVAQSLRPTKRGDYDADFVVDDDNEPLGVPDGLHDIPLEFTHQAHKPLKEHFKDAVEWMVQRKINPSFNYHDPIYIQAFRKLEPEARGLAQSKFSSAAWTGKFTRALWARPVFQEQEIDAGGEHEDRKCDACGRRKYPVRYIVQLKGKPYSQDTLEEVDNGHDGESDSSESSESVNSRGQEIPSEDKMYFLGRFCRANAERAHSLIHWKHALNEWVVQALEERGYLKPEKLAERINWSKKKLSSLANEIVDEWADKGDIKGLYKDFKRNIETSRNTEQGRWNP